MYKFEELKTVTNSEGREGGCPPGMERPGERHAWSATGEEANLCCFLLHRTSVLAACLTAPVMEKYHSKHVAIIAANGLSGEQITTKENRLAPELSLSPCPCTPTLQILGNHNKEGSC